MRRASGNEELVPLPVERPAPSGDRPGPPGRRGASRALTAGALLAGLIVTGILVGTRPDDAPGDRSAPPEASSDEPPPPGWRRGAPGPLLHRDHAAQVWTGTELVVWGGDPDGDSGAAYHPEEDEWRAIAPAPIPARCQGATAWTGSEVVVAGPACRGTASAAAAYDPADDRWRPLTLSGSPLLGGDSAVSAWTGSEWVVVTRSGSAAALDPSVQPAGRWRPLAAAPEPFTVGTAAWTGRELLVFGTDAFTHWVAALDLAANTWRSLPGPRLELAATAVWDGERLIAWDQNLHTAALDPAGAGSWTDLPDLPVDFTDCQPQGARLGDVVFAEHCGQGAVLRPTAGAWERIPHPRSLAERPVWTGRDALFWIGRFAGSADGVWLYRPPV